MKMLEEKKQEFITDINKYYLLSSFISFLVMLLLICIIIVPNIPIFKFGEMHRFLNINEKTSVLKLRNVRI